MLYLIGFFVIGAMTYRLMNWPRNLPPGPIGLPVLGVLWGWTDDLSANMTRLGDIYGDIVSVYIGTE